MTVPDGIEISVQNAPRSADVRFLEEQLSQFNVQTTGITDAELLGVFLKDAAGAVRGGAYGWTWGGTCYLRYLFVAAPLRGHGQGRRLMETLEAEARRRGCGQVLLETHDFQAPEFYRKLGFKVTGIVDRYPRGHQYLTLVKGLDR